MTGEVRTVKPDLKGFLEKHIGSVQAVAAATLNPERMTRLVCAAASRDEKLASCSPMSILRSLAQAASMGLEPFDGRNEVYLIPRWNKKANGGKGGMEATCLVGYPGLIRLATDTGKVNYLDAQVVHEKDEFDYALGDDPFVKHKPTLSRDRGPKIAVYAIAKLATGEKKVEIMPWHEVEAIRDRSKDGKDAFSPWKTDGSEMGRKTGIRRISKYLPKSQALANALEVQAKTEAGEYFDADVVRPGDANPPEVGVSTNEDGFWVWSEEDKVSFLNMMDDLKEACIKAKLTETATEEKIGFYMEQKRACEDSPEKVMNRVHTAIEGLENDAKKLEAKA
jgi:recombination protein RecT